MENIQKCIYAGDKSDEYCKDCNGIEIETSTGEKVPATRCGGYAISEPSITTSAEPTEPTTPPTEPTTTPTEPTITPEPIFEPEDSNYTTENENTVKTNSELLGEVTEIQISSSVSREIQGQWFKLTYCETRAVPKGAKVELIRQHLWAVCNAEVDAQLNDILGK